MHLLFKQHGAERENENRIGLILAKTLALRLVPHCAGCMKGLLMFFSFMYLADTVKSAFRL